MEGKSASCQWPMPRELILISQCHMKWLALFWIMCTFKGICGRVSIDNLDQYSIILDQDADWYLVDTRSTLYRQLINSRSILYRSKVSYHRLVRHVSFLARLVSRETRLVSRETRRVLFLASALEVPMLRICRYSKPVLLIRCLYRIVLISAVDTILILISNACVPCVYCKFSSVQYCFIYIGQTFFYSSQTCLTFSFCKYMHDKSWRYLNRLQQSLVFTNMFHSCINSLGYIDLEKVSLQP